MLGYGFQPTWRGMRTSQGQSGRFPHRVASADIHLHGRQARVLYIRPSYSPNDRAIPPRPQIQAPFPAMSSDSPAASTAPSAIRKKKASSDAVKRSPEDDHRRKHSCRHLGFRQRPH